MTNIAEILRNCPKGTVLYSPICGECELVSIEKNSESLTTIVVKAKLSFWDNEYCDFTFTEDGRAYYEGECLLFPSKDCRDWSTFSQPMFKKGDFVISHSGTIGIFRSYPSTIGTSYVFCSLNNKGSFYNDGNIDVYRLATDFEKQQLLKAIDENGYVWDEEKLDLRKKEQQFKEGDFIVQRQGEISIFKCYRSVFRTSYISFCSIDTYGCLHSSECIGLNFDVRLSTEEEKQQLLKAIDENGYVWDGEKLELRKKELEIYPGEYYTCVKEFKHNGHDVLKVGKTYRGSDSSCHCVTGEENRMFIVGHDANNAAEYLRESTIDEIRSFIKEKNKQRFKPFDKVIVKYNENDEWMCDIFSHMHESDYEGMQYACIGGCWKHCLPYEGNEHLLGMTKNPE